MQNAALLLQHLEQHQTESDGDYRFDYDAGDHNGLRYMLWFAGEATGVTQALSISTATDRCKRLTETISRLRLPISSMSPSKPSSDPPSRRTRCPTCKNGWGDTLSLE